MKPRRHLILGSILVVASVSTSQSWADMFDIDGTTAGFGVANGGSYDWLGTNFWAATPNDTGTAATTTWVTGRSAYLVGLGSGTNYTVRLGSTGSTNVTLTNLAINLNAATTGALAGATGNVTIGNSGDTGLLVLNANNSVGALGGGTLTINNGVNLNAKTMNIRGGNIVINGVVSGTGASKIAFGALWGLSSGTLTLANTANTYAGRANTDYINSNYTLAVTKLANGGSNSSIGTSSANIGINGGTLKYIGSTGAQSTTLGLHIASGGAILDASGSTSSDTISISGTPTFSAANQAGNISLTGTNAGENTMAFAFGNNGTTNTSITKSGTGRWVVNQSNSYSAGTNANGGTLVGANSAAFGVAGRVINFNTGTVEFATDTTANAYVLNVGSGNTGTVVVNSATASSTMTHTMGTATIGNGTMNFTKGANVSGDAILEFGGITMSAGATGLSTGTMLNPTTAKVLVSGNITRTGTLANLLTLDGTNSGNQISGVISGTQALTKSNTSTWILSNANTFTGTTKVTGGSLILKNNLALQSSAFDTSGAGTLDLTDSSINSLTLGGLIGDSGTGQNLVLPSNVTGLTLNPSGTVTYTKNLSGGATGLTLTKSGTGTQILSGTNTYTGLTTVSAGELRVTNAGAIGGSNVTVTSGQLALDGGITVSGKSITTSGNGNNFLGGLQSVTGTNEWAGSVALGADLSRIGARKNASLVVSGVVDDGASSFGLVIRNEGAGTNNNGAGNANTIVVLSGANTYGGNTQLINGLTKLDGGDNRLPTTTVLQFGLSTTNAKFDMNGRNQEVAGLAVTSSGTDANRDWNSNELTNSSATLSTLTVNTTADQTFGGTLTNNVGTITGNIDLVKEGSAKLTLSSTNTYTGSTTVNAGTLVINGNISTSVTTVNSGGTLAGSGTTGSVLVSNGGTLAPGNSPGTLTISGDLGLNETSILAFELNPFDTTAGSNINDLITGISNFTLNGLLNVTATSGSFATVTTGSWRLFNYSGTLTDNILTLNSLPTLASGYNWDLDISTPGQVNLVVIPEPRAALLGGLGVLALLRRRRH